MNLIMRAVYCAVLGLMFVPGAWAAEAAKRMSLDDCTVVLEKLKVDGKIKQYTLRPGENGLLRLDLGGSAIVDLTPLKGMPLSDLVLSGTKVTDLSPLLECPELEKLLIPETCEVLDPLLKMKNLKFISENWDWWSTKAEDFWKANNAPGRRKIKNTLEKLQADGTIKKFSLMAGENGILKVNLSNSGITNLSVLKGLPIEWLHINGGDQDPSLVVTLAGLEGMPLKELSLSGNVALEDISAIRGAPLKVFKISGTHHGSPKVTDISALKGMQLTTLGLGAPVEDLSPLAGMPLEEVFIAVAAKDVNVLKGMPLKSVYVAGAVTDISALKGLPLTWISLHGANQLVDLRPLAGMPLAGLDLYGVKATDLSPLKGMPITMDQPPFSLPPGVTDLGFLAGMPLPGLDLSPTKIADLTPLKAVPALRNLRLSPAVKDLSPLHGMKLTSLEAAGCKELADLRPLAGMPLKSVDLRGTAVTDVSPLASCVELESVVFPAGAAGGESLSKLTKLKTVNGLPVAKSWPQWRGPERNGVATKGPALLAPWPAKGPKQVWQSDPIPTGKEGGFGSVVVVDGKAYLFVGLKEPLITRTIAGGERWAIDLQLAPDGPDKLLEAIAQSSEAARLSPEREKLKPEELQGWAEGWLAKHLNEDEQKKFGPWLKNRLVAGNRAVALALLPKLEAARKKEFANQAELDTWFQDNAIQGQPREAVMRLVRTMRDETKDAIFCLDAATGKTLWKKEYPGAMPDGESSGSSTPAVVDGRCYVGGTTALYCLDAVDGAEIWKSTPPEFGPHNSSPLLVDGMVVLRAGGKLGLAAFAASNGKLLWNEKQIASGRGCSSSATAWIKDGTSYVLCNDDKQVFCLEAKTGKTLWSVPGGGAGSPVVSGDYLITAGALNAYKMTPEKAEKVWSRGSASGTTAVIFDNHVYACTGKHFTCTRLGGDGKPLWDQVGKLSGGDSVEYGSPILADGKLFTIGENGLLTMLKATPEKFELLGKVESSGAADSTTPAIVGGMMYLRMKASVACFDLTKPAE